MKKQQGAALIVVLVLLAISLMLGLSGVQSSLLGERMAGNYRAATLAQMAAEANADIGLTVLEGRNFEKSAFIEVNDLMLPDWSEVSSPWVACDPCESGYGAYALVNLVGSAAAPDGYYVIGMGAVKDGADKVMAESLPVFVKVRKKFSFKYALNVLGGIKDINGEEWLPTSKNAVFSKGNVYGDTDPISPEAVYYEGEPHACEKRDPQDIQPCYAAKNAFEGRVIRADTGDNTASKRFEELYREFKDNVNVVTDKNDIIYRKSQEYEECKATSQLVIVQSIDKISGNKMFCGVLMVWGGDLIKEEDLETNGNPRVKGTVIMANYKDQGNGEPDFNLQGEVSINIRGGGNGAVIEFDRDMIHAAFANAGISESYVDQLTREQANQHLSGVVASWR